LTDGRSHTPGRQTISEQIDTNRRRDTARRQADADEQREFQKRERARLQRAMALEDED
jgi:hypothetical protein